MKAVVWPLLILTVLAFVGCAGDDDDGPVTATATAPSPAAGPSGPAATATGTNDGLFDFAVATTTASSLSYIDLEEGTGAQPRPDQVVAVRYTGRLADTGEVFDSTADGPPVSFQLTRVIKGFAEGIRSMHTGGHRLMYIPADLAYGDKPPPGSGIPAGADLIFEVELVSVK